MAPGMEPIGGPRHFALGVTSTTSGDGASGPASASSGTPHRQPERGGGRCSAVCLLLHRLRRRLLHRHLVLGGLGRALGRHLDQVDLLLELLAVRRHLGAPRLGHAQLPEALLPLLAHLADLLHRRHRLGHRLAIVLERPVAAALQLKRGILSELLPSCLAVRLGPAHLARIPLHFEVLVALGAAEVEHLRVIPDERDAVARVDGAGAEPALDETHSCYLAAPPPSRAAAAAVAASPRPPTLASANRLAASQPTGSTSEFAAAGGGVPSRG
mmetsp:Transcript_39583/g.99493  ORF Transcript_39583/g.99493 Transcript_39583/m.99493 type:complete len:271 (+) Transcript_39583:53-865(+)